MIKSRLFRYYLGLLPHNCRGMLYVARREILARFRGKSDNKALSAPVSCGSDAIRPVWKLSCPAVSGSLQQEIAEEADGILKGRFRLFGIKQYNIGSPPAWRSLGQEGPVGRDGLLKKGQSELDVRAVWEASRLSAVVQLALAGRLLHQERYVQAVQEWISDWQHSNPIGSGINWTCTMEVAIRAVNLLCVYELLGECLPAEARESLGCLIADHGDYVCRNLETHIPSNHLIADYTALVLLGIAFNGGYQGQHWHSVGIRGLQRELGREIRPEGTSFENATHYHLLVAECYLHVLHAEREAGQSSFSRREAAKIARMWEAIAAVCKPTGTLPAFGDSDSSRLIRWTGGQAADCRALSLWASEVLGKAAVQCGRPDSCEGELIGRLLLRRSPSQSTTTVPTCRGFPGAGWYVAKSSTAYVAFLAGGTGFHGLGSHGHNDKLSVVWQVRGRDVLIDPGTFTYTHDHAARNSFRSTSYHNTLAVEGMGEQNDFLDERVFVLVDRSRARCRSWDYDVKNRVATFEGQHRGFRRGMRGVIHRRTVRAGLDADWLEVTDYLRLAESGGTAGSVFLCLAPSIRVVDSTDAMVHLENTDVLQAYRLDYDPSCKCQIEQIWYSSEFGNRQKSLRIELSFPSMKPDGIRWRLCSADAVVRKDETIEAM